MGQAVSTGSPEFVEAARVVALLMMDKLRDDGTLGVRQRQQLRRALLVASEELDWASLRASLEERIAAARRDVEELVILGIQGLEKEVANVLEEKRGEMGRLQELVESIRTLAADPDTAFPVTLEYSHTGRNGSRSVATKAEVLTVNDAKEAAAAADALERKLDGYEKLRVQMVEELKERSRTLREMKKEVSQVAPAFQGMMVEVLATLA
ncbi:MAG: hypothetical protein WEA09_07610 [Gemmatimonadota bacterium]